MFHSAPTHQAFIEIGRHGFLDRGHVQALAFAEHKSRTSVVRSLGYLVDDGLIQVVGSRMIPAARRGGGKYIYRLTEKGRAFYPGKPRAARLPDMDHTLVGVDALLTLLELEREGSHKLVESYPEPETWTKIEGVDLRPDRFAEVEDIAAGYVAHLWLEIDMDHEPGPRITKKLRDYIKAKEASGEWADTDSRGNVTATYQVGPETFPLVLFLVPEVRREAQLRRLIDNLKEEARAARARFDVATTHDFKRWMTNQKYLP